MKHDSEFVFEHKANTIAFVCDMSVDYEEICFETYLNFYRHKGLDLQFSTGILATKDCYMDP